MNIEQLVSRLKNVRPCGKGWMALCPAHADRSPSLSIREDRGKILLHCFAGCPVEAVCAAVGIRLSDLFVGRREPSKPKPAIAGAVERQLSGLRSRLTPRERNRSITVVVASREAPDLGIARALALSVEGEIVQVAFGDVEP